MRASRSRRPRAILETLVRDYLEDERVLICPSVERKMREPYWPARRPPSTLADDMAYCYVSGLRQTDPYDRVLAFDEEWSHYDEGVNVLRTGGHVEWVADAGSVRDAVAEGAGKLAAAGRRVEVLRPWWSRSPEPPPFFRMPEEGEEEGEKERRRWPYPIAAAALAAGALLLSLHRRRRRARQARVESERAWEERHGSGAKGRDARRPGRPTRRPGRPRSI